MLHMMACAVHTRYLPLPQLKTAYVKQSEAYKQRMRRGQVSMEGESRDFATEAYV